MTEPAPLSPEELAQVEALWHRLLPSGPDDHDVFRLAATVRAAWERERTYRAALAAYRSALRRRAFAALPADRQEQP